MKAASSAWDRLGSYLRETQLLGSIQSALYWDQNTRMPSGGSPWRGEQLSLLATQLHARQSADHYAELIHAARQEWADSSETEASSDRGRNLDLLEQDLRRQRALDPALVAALAMAKSEGYKKVYAAGSHWRESEATASSETESQQHKDRLKLARSEWHASEWLQSTPDLVG